MIPLRNIARTSFFKKLFRKSAGGSKIFYPGYILYSLYPQNAISLKIIQIPCLVFPSDLSMWQSNHNLSSTSVNQAFKSDIMCQTSKDFQRKKLNSQVKCQIYKLMLHFDLIEEIFICPLQILIPRYTTTNRHRCYAALRFGQPATAG